MNFTESLCILQNYEKLYGILINISALHMMNYAELGGIQLNFYELYLLNCYEVCYII